MDAFLEKYTPFIDAYLELSTQELHTKKTLLLREGMICHKLYFIKKGILRFFYYNEAGEDITHLFLFEHDFITEIDSFFFGKKSEFYMEVIEDCELYSINHDAYQTLINREPEILKLLNAISLKFLVRLGEKIKDLQFRDARTRYRNLLDQHPDILNRVALGHIASYLGITQQSLSRIRKEK